jgi:hypothetical protein
MLKTLAMSMLAEAAAGPRLNAFGWTIMLVSVSTVVSMTGYCLYRVLNLPPVEMDDIKGPLEIDTGDTRNAD